MERGKMSSTGRGGKSKAPQHPQDIFALGSKSTVVVSRDSEKRNIHKPSTSSVAERKRETATFGSQPPSKRARIGSPAEAVSGTSLEVDPVDLVPNVLQALDTHNSDKLLGLLTGSIRLLKSQRSKPDPILCMSMLYLTKIRPNMFAHETVTQTLCTLLKREQGAAFKSKGNPLVFVLACNMLYAGHRDGNNWPDTFIKVYIEDALNERWWVDCSWCKCLVENIVTAFGTKQPAAHLIPSDNTLGTMSPSGSGSPLMGSNEDDTDNTELEYSVFPRYSSSYETVEALVLEAIKEQIQRRAAPDAIGKGFLKLLSATCGFPEIRMIAASRLEAWLHSGKLWRAAQELLAHVCANAHAAGPSAARDHEVLAQLARMRLKTKPLQAAYQACLREMVSESTALLRSVVTHTIYNELSNVRSPNNMAVLAALIQAQPQLVPAAMADTYQELVVRTEDYLRPLRALTRECVRATRSDAQALLPLARALAQPPPLDPPQEVRERAFQSLADLFCLCCLVTAAHSKHASDYRSQLCALQQQALGWLLDTAVAVYRPVRHDCLHVLNKIMFVEPAETYSKVDNWPPESERALTYRLCCEAPLPQNTLLRLVFIGLSKDIPVPPTEVFELIEQLVRRACALPPEDQPLQVDKLEIADYIFQLCQFHPPDNITLPAGYTPPALAITSLYWRGWMLLTMLAAHNPQGFAERAANTYPTLRALIECCITSKPSIEWSGTGESERLEAERATVLQLETHLAAASNAKLPVTEHSSRLLAQLTTLEPLGPARRPPAGVLEALQALSSQLRLGRLLCRQPALLLQLVERHGTRRAMPWLHQLLRHDRLELSVLPVQCLCEFLSAGGAGAGEAGKAGELCAHLRRTLHSEEGARAVLHYYLQRLAHAHAPTRASASRGLKLVLSQSDDAIEMDYNADVNPESWLSLLPSLRHWEVLRGEAVRRVRAACLVECAPPHVAAYLGFLAQHAHHHHPHDLTDMVLDLSQVLMERTTVMGYVLPPVDSKETPRDERLLAQHKALHALTTIFYTHLRQVLSNEIDQLVAALESATPSTLEALGNEIIETQDTQVVVDTITHLLEKNQEGRYELQVKADPDEEKFSACAQHVLSRRGLGCGLLLDWLSELQRETLGRQMRLMFQRGGGAWRPLLVTLLAHRASWRTLHAALVALTEHGGWSAKAVLDFAETLIGSPRVWQGRDRATPKHHSPDDSLRLSYHQLGVLIGYVGAEAREAEAAGGAEAARRRIEARLPLVLRCCSAPHALLAAALAASRSHPLLLLLLYMKVPKVLQLLRECEDLPPATPQLLVAGEARAVARRSTSATDRVAHALLTALAAPHHHSKEHSQKMWRTEAGARGVFARCAGAGARALPLAGALLRGVRARQHHHLQHLLAALEVLPDADLFEPPAGDEVHGILECFLNMLKGGGGGGGGSLAHRVAALLRRYRAARPQRAATLLHAHRDTIASQAALAGVAGGEGAASAAPPPHALQALRRRVAPPDELHWLVQEVEAWGVRRGGAWGGAASADALLRATAPLAASPHAPLRTATLSLLTKLLPAAPDTHPGLQAILECLDSDQPEIAQSVLDKLPELVVGMQEHAARILTFVFELGLRSRLPVEQCIAKCVSTINLNRGC
nr:integrator complex subunit 1 [Vanessa tameamea]